MGIGQAPGSIVETYLSLSHFVYEQRSQDR